MNGKKTFSDTGWIYESYLEGGFKDEEFVSKILTSRMGGSVEMSDPIEDMDCHVDFWWTCNGVVSGVDVKGRKKVCRGDDEPDDAITWLEFKNVHGNDGWMKGYARYIAFMLKNEVLFVDREKLLSEADRRIDWSKVSDVRPLECWKLYTRSRWGRKDLMCMVETRFLSSIAEFTLSV